MRHYFAETVLSTVIKDLASYSPDQITFSQSMLSKFIAPSTIASEQPLLKTLSFVFQFSDLIDFSSHFPSGEILRDSALGLCLPLSLAVLLNLSVSTTTSTPKTSKSLSSALTSLLRLRLEFQLFVYTWLANNHVKLHVVKIQLII